MYKIAEIDFSVADFFLRMIFEKYRPAYDDIFEEYCSWLHFLYNHTEPKWEERCWILDWVGKGDPIGSRTWMMNAKVFQIINLAKSNGCDWVEDAEKELFESRPKLPPTCDDD